MQSLTPVILSTGLTVAELALAGGLIHLSTAARTFRGTAFQSPFRAGILNIERTAKTGEDSDETLTQTPRKPQ